MERSGLKPWLFFFVMFIGGTSLIFGQVPRRFPLPRAGAVRTAPSVASEPLQPSSSVTRQSEGVLLLDEAGTPLRLTLSGVGHIRAASQAPDTPYPLGWEAALMVKAQPNKSLWFDVRLDMNQQRIGQTYGTGQFIYPRVSATWVVDVRDSEFFALTTRVGDLRKMTAGKGLFYKDQSEEGLSFELKGKTQTLSVGYLAHGLVASTDVVIADWRNSDQTLGVVADIVRSDLSDAAWTDSRLSVYGKTDVWGVMSIDWEGAGTKYSGQDGWGTAVLVAPSKEIKLSDTYGFLGASYRGYFGSTVSGVRAQLSRSNLSTVRSDLFDEELDWESYRSIIGVTQTDHEIQTLGIRVKIERLFIANWWLFGDYEWVRIMPHTESVQDRVFWSAGLKAALSQHHYAYLGIQTKFLGAIDSVNGQNNQPYLAGYDPTWVVGVKFKF